MHQRCWYNHRRKFDLVRYLDMSYAFASISLAEGQLRVTTDEIQELSRGPMTHDTSISAAQNGLIKSLLWPASSAHSYPIPELTVDGSIWARIELREWTDIHQKDRYTVESDNLNDQDFPAICRHNKDRARRRLSKGSLKSKSWQNCRKRHSNV